MKNRPIYPASDLRTTIEMIRSAHMYPMIEFKNCENMGKFSHWLAVQVEENKAIIYSFDVDDDGDNHFSDITVSETTFAELLNAWTASLLCEEPHATLTVYPR